jgi:hypothetical protein
MTKSDKAKPRKAKTRRQVTGEDDFQSDLETKIKKCAENERERRVTLAEALSRWANVDIARLERVDGGDRCGWAMWERSG